MKTLKKLMINEIFFQSLLAFVVRGFAAVSGFILTYLLAINLGAEQAGYFFLAFAIITFLSAIGRVGLDQTVLRQTAIGIVGNSTTVIFSVLKKSLLISGLLSTLLWFFVFFLSDYIAVELFGKLGLASPLRSISFGLIGLSLLTLVAMSLQGLNRILNSVFVLSLAVNTLFILFLLLFDFSTAAAAAFLYSILTVVVFFGALFFWIIVAPVKKYKNKEVVSWTIIFNSCLPLSVVMIMSQLIHWSGQLIAGAWIDPMEFSQLVVAQRIAMLASFVLIAVNLVVAPRFVKLHSQGDMDGLKELVAYSVRLMLFFSIPILIIMIFFSKQLVGLFGPEYTGGAKFLQILAIGQFINTASGSVGYLLTLTGNEKSMRNTMLIAGFFAVAASLILVPLYGATGGAIATALAVVLENLIAVWFVRRRLGINTLAFWRRY